MPNIVEINGLYYDFEPKNTSFALTAKELKNLGIKNYYFMLRVNNPRSLFIDPFNPKITKQEVQILMREYMHNMWAFMRDAVKVRSQKGIVPFYLHRGLAFNAWCLEHNQDSCICEPRQTYKTTGTIAGPIQWVFQTTENSKIHFYGKTIENTKDNLQHLRDDISLLPKWLQFTRYISEGKEQKANMSTEHIYNGKTHNELFIHPKPTSVSTATSMGRGQSGNVLLFDELAHTSNIDVLWHNSSFMYATARENALEAGLPSARLCTCNPPNIDTPEGKCSDPLIRSMIPWTEKIYDMSPNEIDEYKDTFRDEFHRMADHPDRDVIDCFYAEYQYFQLRKTYDWVIERFRQSGSRQEVRRDILLINVRGSTNSFIDQEDLEYFISNMVKSGNELLINNKWVLKIYEHGAKQLFDLTAPFDPSIPYLIGVDPAGGASGHRGDYFAVTIVNPNNMKIAAEFHSQFMGAPEALLFFQELILKYMPGAVLCIEKNNMGVYLIQILSKSDIGRNMYWSEKGAERELDYLTYESAADKELRKMSEEYGKYGTFVNRKVKGAMFELLKMHIKECKENLCTEYLVNDMCKLVMYNGNPQAEKGEHDDSIMSYLHAIYVYYTGDNLPFFGIKKKFYPSYKDDDIVQDEQNLTMQDVFKNMGYIMREPTFDEEYQRQLREARRETQEMVDKLPFVESFGYGKTKTNIPLGEELVDIDSSFFDSLNGI